MTVWLCFLLLLFSSIYVPWTCSSKPFMSCNCNIFFNRGIRTHWYSSTHSLWNKPKRNCEMIIIMIMVASRLCICFSIFVVENRFICLRNPSSRIRLIYSWKSFDFFVCSFSVKSTYQKVCTHILFAQRLYCVESFHRKCRKNETQSQAITTLFTRSYYCRVAGVSL